MQKKSLGLACLLALAAIGRTAAADPVSVDQLQQQIEVLQSQINAMRAQMARPAAAPAAQQDSPTSMRVGAGKLQVYGHADVSADGVDNGQQRWSQVSSNTSYIGVRGSHPLADTGLTGLFQLETLMSITNTPTETSSLGSRDSFVGISGNFGAVKIGKSDTPYKKSTSKMDPLANTVGDYNAIMGNTGGDLRAEFDMRLPHSVWYESPNLNGLQLTALYSPGQKLNDLGGGDEHNAYPTGEKVCSGATPGSSGSTPGGTGVCDDGAFKNAYSVALNYSTGPLTAIAAYELHKDVNRTSDTNGIISNESAAKAGASYKIGPHTVSLVYEDLMRSGGINPEYNERARKGYYLSDLWKLGYGNELMGAWAHAGKTPGGPDFGTLDDHANLYSLGARHWYDRHTSVYLVGSLLKQGPGAHYALGASGHGIPIATPRSETGFTVNDGSTTFDHSAPGDTMGGQTLKAMSMGVTYDF